MRRRNREFDRLPGRLQRIGLHKDSAITAVGRKPALDDFQIANHQRSLVLAERSRAGMADEDRRCADMTKAALPGAQAEIDVLEISAVIIFRQGADGVETAARYIKTKADSIGNIDHAADVSLHRSCTEDRVRLRPRVPERGQVFDCVQASLSVCDLAQGNALIAAQRLITLT